MNLQRETIFAALATRLTNKLVTNGPFIFVNRRLRPWDAISAAEQPCVFIEQRDQRATQLSNGGHFTATKWILEAWLWVYARIDSQPGTIPSTQINNLLDAIEQALQPDIVGQWQTLGVPTLIEHCWIEGNVFVNEGLDDQQSLIVVPVYIATGNY